jgi:hypothetical protein
MVVSLTAIGCITGSEIFPSALKIFALRKSLPLTRDENLAKSLKLFLAARTIQAGRRTSVSRRFR